MLKTVDPVDPEDPVNPVSIIFFKSKKSTPLWIVRRRYLRSGPCLVPFGRVEEQSSCWACGYSALMTDRQERTVGSTHCSDGLLSGQKSTTWTMMLRSALAVLSSLQISRAKCQNMFTMPTPALSELELFTECTKLNLIFDSVAVPSMDLSICQLIWVLFG